MHLGGLQGCGLSVRTDEMFFGNKKPGTPAEGPLRRLSQFLQSIFCLFRFAGRGSGPLRGMGLQLGELRLEAGRPPENAKRAYQQDRDPDDEQRPLVILLQPIHQLALMLMLMLLLLLIIEILFMSSTVRARV